MESRGHSHPACYQFEDETTSYYEALDVSENAEYAEIRGRYRAAVLAMHPDKTVAQGGDLRHEGFVRIQRAWEVLSDRESRAAYDTFLLRQRTARGRELACKVISDVVDMEDMEKVEGWGYVYPCRCGDSFAVSTQELEECHMDRQGTTQESCNNNEKTPEPRGGSENASSIGIGDRQSLVLPCASCSLHLRVDLCPGKSDIAGQDISISVRACLLQDACIQPPQGGAQAMQLFIQLVQPAHDFCEGHRWRISSCFRASETTEQTVAREEEIAHACRSQDDMFMRPYHPPRFLPLPIAPSTAHKLCCKGDTTTRDDTAKAHAERSHRQQQCKTRGAHDALACPDSSQAATSTQQIEQSRGGFTIR